MTAESNHWEKEFLQTDFVDQRLKTRFFKIMDAFAAAPGKSTRAAAGSRSSAKAAYRFFGNADVSREEILDSISRATVEKMKNAGAEWVLAVQDTTSVGFGDRKAIKGMGYHCSTGQGGCLCIPAWQSQTRGFRRGFFTRKQTQGKHVRMVQGQRSGNVPGQ